MAYITEDGNILSEEDFWQYAILKVKELKEDDYSIEDILLFDDNIDWIEFVIKHLKIDEYT